MALPADITAECLIYRTRMASRAMSRAANAALRPMGLQITQFALLVTLSRGDDEPIAAMADRLDVEPSTLTRNLKRLEARGLIAGAPGRGRGGRRLGLTPAGEALLQAAYPIWASAQARLAQALDGRTGEMRAILAQLERAALSLTPSIHTET